MLKTRQTNELLANQTILPGNLYPVSSTLFQQRLLALRLQIGTLATILDGQLLAQALDLALAKLEREVPAVGHGVELLDGLGRDEKLHEAVDKAHDGGDVDEELLLQQLRVVLRKDLDGLGAGGLDLRRRAEEADGLVVMHLIDLVRVLDVRDGLSSRRDGELLQGELHEGDAPLDEPARG